MLKKYTAGTRQLTVEIEAGLRERIAERVKAEDRSLRKVVERALLHYLETVPVNGGSVPASPAKKKGKGK